MKKYYSRLQEIAGIKQASLLTENNDVNVENEADVYDFVKDIIEETIDKLVLDNEVEYETDSGNQGGQEYVYEFASLRNVNDFAKKLSKTFLHKDYTQDTKAAMRLMGYTKVNDFMMAVAKYFDEVLGSSDITYDRSTDDRSIEYNWKIDHKLKK